jgi:bla regulator protein blaR1
MIFGLASHLWQSTLFAGAAWLLVLTLGKNPARLRYAIWFLASVKFLVPFSILAGIGALAPRRMAAPPAQVWVRAAEEIGRPFTTLPAAATRLALPAEGHSPNDWWVGALALWACGFAAVAVCWLARWMRVRAIRRSASVVNIPAVSRAIPVLSAPGIVEPGIFGIFRPVLLLPEGLEQRLDRPQLDAILAHELCHVRCRDNLTAAIHMVSQAIFWFHPLVWWLGARLVDERERACDEEVLHLGSEPRVYAAAILNVCKHYVETPLACVSGVTGSNLKKRIEAIMTNRIAARLNFTQKALLGVAAAAALAVPVAVGVVSAPAIQAQSASVPRPKFEVASVKRCTLQDMPPAGARGTGGGRGSGGVGGGGAAFGDPGMFRTGCVPVRWLIQMAYIRYAEGHALPPGSQMKNQPLQGGPDWIDSDRYTIDARPASPQTKPVMAGPMLQALLEDRFKLKIHRQSKEVPVYALVVAKGGSKLQPTKEGGCRRGDPDGPPLPVVPGQPLPCGYMDGSEEGGLDAVGVPVASLCPVLSSQLPRKVIDKTGLTGLFNYHLNFNIGPPNSAPQEDDPAAADQFAMVTAALQKLGLRLEAARGTAEFIVIDHVERPSEN